MKVGFIVTAHWSDKIRPNGDKLLARYLRSIYDSCDYNFHIYIIDNESQHELRPPGDKISYTRIDDQHAKGLTGAWNLGLHTAYHDDCDILINCNDDLWFDKTINKLIEYIPQFEDSDNIVFGGLTNGMNTGPPRVAAGPGEGFVRMACDSPSTVMGGYCFAMTKEHYVKFRSSDIEYFDKDNKHNGGDGKWGGQEGQFIVNAEAGSYGCLINECFINHDKIRAWTIPRNIERDSI